MRQARLRSWSIGLAVVLPLLMASQGRAQPVMERQVGVAEPAIGRARGTGEPWGLPSEVPGLAGKGGKQNFENEFVRNAQKQSDPCAWLAEKYRGATSSQEQMKIQLAQKVLDCRNKLKRKNS